MRGAEYATQPPWRMMVPGQARFNARKTRTFTCLRHDIRSFGDTLRTKVLDGGFVMSVCSLSILSIFVQYSRQPQRVRNAKCFEDG